jgi:hypothetical protein
MAEENKIQKLLGNLQGDGKAKAHHSGGRNQCPCQHWNQGHQSGKFRGETKEIKFGIFNNTGPHNAAQFNKSLKNIADHLQLTHCNDVSKAIRNMSPIIITVPPTPQGTKDPANPMGKTILPITDDNLYLWKIEHAKAQDS